MKDNIIAGTGNSRGLKTTPGSLNRYPTHEALMAAFDSGNFLFDLFLNPAGCLQVGDPLNKSTLLKESTAASYGLDEDAVPDDMFHKIFSKDASLRDSTAALYGWNDTAVPDDIFQDLFYKVYSGKTVQNGVITDQFGEPISGIAIDNLQTVDGHPAVTDENGWFSAVVNAARHIIFYHPTDLTISQKEVYVQPNKYGMYPFLNITLNRAQNGKIIEILMSGSYFVPADHTALVCCVGAGTAGASSYSGGGSSAINPLGNGGTGGKIFSLENEVLLTEGEEYEIVAGRSGGASTFSDIASSASGNVENAPFSDPDLYNYYGGNGGVGARAAKSVAVRDSSSGSRAGGGGAGAATRYNSGSTRIHYWYSGKPGGPAGFPGQSPPYEKDDMGLGTGFSGKGGDAGIGGGGGGAGYADYPSGLNASGGRAGIGAVLLKFLD